MPRRGSPVQSDLVALDGGAAKACAPGKVWLVGAGPGDPELLTLKAVRVLGAADVVVHDRLVAADVLDLVPAAARRLYVGKQKARHALPQDDINALLVGLAREGLSVVRLKGGDPFVFGRGGEEMLACRAAGIDCEIVPGVSAALAASASAGAPLTHRGLAQAVTFVTGHAQDGGAPALDWPALAGVNHTVVVYMGLSTAPMISERLIAAGRAPATPVAIVENASQAAERRAVTTLAGLSTVAAGFDGPAILIIGEVAELAVVSPLEETGLRVRCSPSGGAAPEGQRGHRRRQPGGPTFTVAPAPSVRYADTSPKGGGSKAGESPSAAGEHARERFGGMPK